ncbi:MAG: SBBP repeat-containing protein [Bacteroidetes bacterium]|nr:SBBP repeat-containing protein [Bacteroidota bacterium]
MNFSTFLGGTLQDYSRGALYDNAYNIVLTGQTYSTNFPILGGLSSTLAGNYDVYISKLNSTGTALIFSSYFGGANQDFPSGLALDNLNDIYICGSTYSTNFPLTGGVIKSTISGVNTFDCFVSKINSTCTSLLYSTYLGGSNWDYAACLRIDKNKNAIICGYTFSSDYHTTIGAYDISQNGSYDGFVTKINPTATSIIFSTFLGGISHDFANSLALDDKNNIYLQLSTLSTNYPFTPGAFKTSFSNTGGYEMVVSSLDSNGSKLRYSTAIGKSNNWGGGWGWGGGNSNNLIITPCGNNVIMSGSTYSNTFPTTNDAFKKTNNPNFWDQYITVIDSSLSTLKYSTFYGGQLHEYWGNNIAFKNNILYSTGNTQSLDYPITPNAYININSLNAQTPTAFSFENFCFLPDPSGVSINPSNFCNSTIQLATFKAKPVRNECTANLNNLVNYWYRNNDRDSVIAKGDSVSLMINPQDSFYLVTVDTFLKCRSRELKLDFSFGIFKWVVNKTICANDSFKVDGIWRKKGGIYYETIKGNPCDTAKTVFLTVFPMIPAFIDTTICFHEVFTFNNKTYDTTNIYYDTLSSSGGCDTLLQINLTKIPKFTNLKYSICNGQFVVINGNAYSTSGIYVNNLVNRKGCDSIVTLDLRVSGAKRDSVYKVMCFGETFKVLNKNYTTSGIRLDTLKSTLTCDSIIYSDLTFKPSTISYDTVIRCETDTFTFKGKIFESSVFDNGKTWIDTVITPTGCSFKNVFLKISPIKYRVSSNLTFTACYPGQGYVVGSKVYKASGHYFDTLPQVNGCDSVIETYLDYIPYTPAPKANFYTSICEGKSITLGNQTHSTAGVFSDTLFSAAGCDSILVFTYLTVLPRVHTYLKDTLCWGKFMYVGNKIRNATGSYVDTIPALNTCDSIIHLDLLVYPKVTYSYTVDICNGQTYFFNNKNLSIAGIYLDTLTNYLNCDSFITLNLKVNPTYYKVRTVNLCAGEGMTIGGVYRTTDGAYLDTLKTSKGCDSITLTNLFFKQKYFNSHNITLCFEDTFYFNSKKYTQTGIYLDTLKSIFACDSIIESIIQKLSLNRKVVKADLCIGDKYFARNAYQTVSGTYIDTFISFQGCDSIVEHQIQFYANFNKVNIATICQGDSFLRQNSIASPQDYILIALKRVLAAIVLL